MRTLVPVLLVLLVQQVISCGFGGCGGGGGCGCAPVVRNSCCGGGSCGGCVTHRRLTTAHRTKRGIRQHMVTLEQSEEDDPTCNSAAIGHIMKMHMTGDPAKSRHVIHELVEEKSPHHFAVICSLQPFFYVADSKQYCAHTNPRTNETCYAFEF